MNQPAPPAGSATDGAGAFACVDEAFADIRLLRYRVPGFETLPLRQKTYIYHLAEAALWGRDILFDQNGRYNLRIRRLLEAVYTRYDGPRQEEPFRSLAVYLKRVWFSNGIHHHYGGEKLVPGFDAAFLRSQMERLPREALPLAPGETADDFCREVFPVIFDPDVMPMRVNHSDGDDLLLTSACNYYGPDVTQAEAEAFYAARKDPADPHPVMTGLNSRLVREDGVLRERTWRVGGLYGAAIGKIVESLLAARPFADNAAQQAVIDTLVDYYRTGDLRTFDRYTIQWLAETDGRVDFVNGFTETYGDPLGLKASWEGYVNYTDTEATRRTEVLSSHAQWFEDHSPVDPRFKKTVCRGISARVVTAAMLGGDLYPSTAIGINLPNSDWVRHEHGSKSVTIGNLTAAYNEAARSSGMDEEFIIDEPTRRLVRTYGDALDDLHTDLHECLGHGSGRLLPGTDPDALRSYGSTIEEARADLFGLYYMADPKLTELGLTPDAGAYRAQYYTYLMNGLMTQLVRIEPGRRIEEAHMRNRALIARWVMERAERNGAAALVSRGGKTYLAINDYAALRPLFAELLAEVQRIKSEGDYEAARRLVEQYGVRVDPALHDEMRRRYARLHLSPYKGFINPVYHVTRDAAGAITDVRIDYTEAYDAQMLRYGRQYRTLPDVNP